MQFQDLPYASNCTKLVGTIRFNPKTNWQINFNKYVFEDLLQGCKVI